MPLAITLDKSTFQGLSHKDLIQLHRYYVVNVTPLLVLEILGDLSKENVEGKKLPKEIVTSLANKIFPYQAHVNMDFKKMLEFSLLGQEIQFDNRPFLTAKKSISDIQNGLVFEETQQEILLREWKKGEFSDLDKIQSFFWRENSKSETVIDDFKKVFKIFESIKLEKSTGDNVENLFLLKAKLFVELDNVANQEKYLTLIIEHFQLNYEVASQIFYRWESEGYTNIKEFSPYAYFCLSIVSMYFTGLNNNLYSDRKTNLLDLEYLFYTPCSKVFSSDDKFLTSLFNLIKPKDVIFVTKKELKNDLGKFQDFEIEKGIVSNIPPVKDSLTYKLWDEVYDLKTNEALGKIRTQRDFDKAKAELQNILDITKDGAIGSFEGEPDFVVKEFNMLRTDPCFCGSGNELKDCCLLKTK